MIKAEEAKANAESDVKAKAAALEQAHNALEKNRKDCNTNKGPDLDPNCWVKALEVGGQVYRVTVMQDCTMIGVGMNHKLYTPCQS